MLPLRHRLKKEADFERVLAGGKKIKKGPSLFFYLPGAEPFRLGLVISKKVSKKATRRNYLRRLLQNIASPLVSNPSLTGEAVLILLYDPQEPLEELKRSLEQCFDALPLA